MASADKTLCLLQRRVQQPAIPPSSTKGSSAPIYVSKWEGTSSTALSNEETDLCFIFFFLSGKVLGNLQLNLLSKSKVYEDAALRAIFLHNNYNYILKSLEKWVFLLCLLPSWSHINEFSSDRFVTSDGSLVPV